MTKERLLILDGHSLMFRAFYALPMLTNSQGLHTNALYGFTNMLLKMKEEIKPDYIVTAFDKKAPTFRHKRYKDYKAGRKKMPQELEEQFPFLKEILSSLAIDIFEVDGFEADDLIGTLSVFAEEKGIEVYIVTGDRDALQLATDNVKVVINKKGMSEKEIYDKDRIIEEYGVTPQQLIDVKGLMGDPSDNIPGVPSIGEKTAYKLIKEYGSVENTLQNIDNISGKRVKENLIEYSEQAVFSKKLATIITDIPIDIDINSIKSKENYDIEELRRIFFKLEFNSLLDKIPQHNKNIQEKKVDCSYEIIDNIESLKKLPKKIKGKIYVNFEIINENVYSLSEITKIYINYNDKNYVIYMQNLIEENKEEAIKNIATIFENKDIEKVGHDLKSSYSIFNKLGISLESVVFDTKIAAYLIDSSKKDYSLNSLIHTYIMIDSYGEGEILFVNETALIPELYEVLSEKIDKEDMKELFYDVEMPLVEVLSSMEVEGIKVDSEKFDTIGQKFESEIFKIQNEIFELAGEEFNINSPKQLSKILFEKLDLPVIKKTKTGYSTDAKVLEALSDKHPIVDKITYYRQLSKIHSTYVEGLKSVIDKDEKIHSSFNQTVTATGRLSSTEPNLQNIPIKYEMGREVRKVFVPENEECVLLSADYSQIELRVLAHISGDENLINAFKEHNDIHTKTASEVFNVSIENVTPLMRNNAKAVNFGIVYGISDFSLSKDIKVSKKEAGEYIDTYFERYPKVKKYMDDIIFKAKEDGYVTTILNRKRFIPQIRDTNKIIRSSGERLAMNTPIQGSAADIIKIAMVNVHKQIKSRKLKSRLILQVHDELILNVYKDEFEEVKDIVKKGMEDVIKLLVPLDINMSFGETWYDIK